MVRYGSDRTRRLRTMTAGATVMGALGLALCVSVAHAQAVLTLGTIKGNIRFTNQDPAVLSIVDGCGLDSTWTQATSTAPLGFTAQNSSGSQSKTLGS